MLIRAFGGHAPGDPAAIQGQETIGTAASPIPSIAASTPDRIRAVEGFRRDLVALAAALAHLTEHEPPAHRGNPEVSDPVLYGIEALAWEWLRRRGADPRRGKTGGFERLAIDVLTSLAPLVQEPEVRTGLRRFFERGGLDGLRSKEAPTG